MRHNHLVPAIDGSALALARLELEPREASELFAADDDSLLYVAAGRGSVRIGGDALALVPHAAALVLAGEEASIVAGPGPLDLLHATVGPAADRHAPLGARETVVSPAESESERATGSRSFRVLFGPHNGSTRATLFAGLVPPRKAPWHYHLYDEIVWVPDGPGRLHLGDGTTDLGPGAACRLRPRQVHIVENASADRELALIGVFTPAGSPSAAYFVPEVAAEYRLSG